jgi:alpha-glucosidase
VYLHDQPHHDGSPLYVSTDRPALGQRVEVWVRVPAGVDLAAVHARTTPDGEPHFTPLAIDPGRTGTAVAGYGRGDTWWRGEVEVRNAVTGYRFLLTPRDGRPPSWLAADGTHPDDLPDATDFRLVAHEAPPAWSAGSIVYEIFPDRFARSAAAGPLRQADVPDWATACDWDRDPVIDRGPETPGQIYGGDLDGIVEHLDHVASLGADTIYLRPVFPGRSNHRYNATTFDVVDPLLGGDAALRRLVDAVHARGMRLVGDITTNHCGDDHEWFLAAAADPHAPEREMFSFHPDGTYESWCGFTTLPKYDWRSPLVRERVLAVMRRWLEFYDGWRVDVANMTGRLRGADDTHAIAADLRREVAAVRPDAILLGEHNHDATGDLDRDGWHGTMYYAGFTRPVWTWLRGDAPGLPDFLGVPGDVPRRDGASALATMRSFAARISWRSLVHSWWLLDSFDSPRFRTVAGSRERHLVGAGLQMTLPGTPMISAGSEFGLSGRNGEDARTPMPWNRPDDRDEATLAGYRALAALRRREPALREGGLRWLYADADALVFTRETAGESLLVAARRADGDPVRLALDAVADGVHEADDLVPVSGVLTLPAGGPSLRVWRLRA